MDNKEPKKNCHKEKTNLRYCQCWRPLRPDEKGEMLLELHVFVTDRTGVVDPHHADTDPDFYLMRMRIRMRIRLFTLMRIRIRILPSK
jgi:hypothetical protein